MTCEKCGSCNLTDYFDEELQEKYFVCKNCGSILNEDGDVDIERTIQSFGY